MKLYELNKAFADAMALYESGVTEIVDTDTGEIHSMEDLLAGLQLSREEKLDCIVKYLKELKSFSQALREEAAATTKRARQKEAQAQRLEAYLLTQLGETKKLETPQYKLTVKDSVETIAPTKQEDLMKLPEDFRTAKWAPNKAAIKKALASGAMLAGCQLAHKKNLSY